MKKSLIITTAGMIAMAICTQAQAQLKIGTVDVNKVMQAYYKTKDATGKLQEAAKAAQDEFNSRYEIYKKDMDEINKLNEEINKPDISAASKDQKSQERDSKIGEMKGLEKDINEFRQTREKQLQDQRGRMLQGIMEEIMKVVSTQVKARNYDLVFDRSGVSAVGVPVVLYARDSYDFSQSVITELNSHQPASATSGGKTKGASPRNTPATTTGPGGFPKPRN
jgi:outer membrane protein